MNSAEIVQALPHQTVQGKQILTFIVILSPVVQVPTELDKQIVVIEHELPGREHNLKSWLGALQRKLARCRRAMS